MSGYCTYNNNDGDRFRPLQGPCRFANQGGSLATADWLEWELLLAKEDTRQEYGEQHMVGLAPIGRKVYCVVFTEEDDVQEPGKNKAYVVSRR